MKHLILQTSTSDHFMNIGRSVAEDFASMVNSNDQNDKCYFLGCYMEPNKKMAVSKTKTKTNYLIDLVHCIEPEQYFGRITYLEMLDRMKKQLRDLKFDSINIIHGSYFVNYMEEFKFFNMYLLWAKNSIYNLSELFPKSNMAHNQVVDFFKMAQLYVTIEILFERNENLILNNLWDDPNQHKLVYLDQIYGIGFVRNFYTHAYEYPNGEGVFIYPTVDGFEIGYRLYNTFTSITLNNCEGVGNDYPNNKGKDFVFGATDNDKYSDERTQQLNMIGEEVGRMYDYNQSQFNIDVMCHHSKVDSYDDAINLVDEWDMYDNYLDKIYTSKYTAILPSYDHEMFSIRRFIESVLNHCIPFIIESDPEKIFPRDKELVSIIKEFLLIDNGLFNLGSMIEMIDGKENEILERIRSTQTFLNIFKHYDENYSSDYTNFFYSDKKTYLLDLDLPTEFFGESEWGKTLKILNDSKKKVYSDDPTIEEQKNSIKVYIKHTLKDSKILFDIYSFQHRDYLDRLINLEAESRGIIFYKMTKEMAESKDTKESKDVVLKKQPSEFLKGLGVDPNQMIQSQNGEFFSIVDLFNAYYGECVMGIEVNTENKSIPDESKGFEIRDGQTNFSKLGAFLEGRNME